MTKIVCLVRFFFCVVLYEYVFFRFPPKNAKYMMVAMINLAPVESFTNCTKHFSNPDILQTHLHMLMNTHKVQSWFTFRDTHKNPYEAMIERETTKLQKRYFSRDKSGSYFQSCLCQLKIYISEHCKSGSDL